MLEWLHFGKSYPTLRTILLSALLFVLVLIVSAALPRDCWRFIPHATDWTAMWASMASFAVIIAIALTLMWKDSPPAGFWTLSLRIVITLAFLSEVLFVGVAAMVGHHGTGF